MASSPAGMGPKGAEDEAPAYAAGPTISRPGDLWELGRHRLLCGDARNPGPYAVLMPRWSLSSLIRPTTFRSTSTCAGLAESDTLTSPRAGGPL
jgi:hypothetical protein